MQLKRQKQQVEAAAKADQLSIERERIASQERIAGAQIGAKVEADKDKLKSKEQVEGARIGIDAAMHHATLSNQIHQQPTKGNE